MKMKGLDEGEGMYSSPLPDELSCGNHMVSLRKVGSFLRRVSTD